MISFLCHHYPAHALPESRRYTSQNALDEPAAVQETETGAGKTRCQGVGNFIELRLVGLNVIHEPVCLADGCVRFDVLDKETESIKFGRIGAKVPLF